MKKLIILLLFAITSCTVHRQTVGQPTVSEEIEISAAPTNKMFIVESGVSKLEDVSVVLENNDVALMSDTTYILATKSDIDSLNFMITVNSSSEILSGQYSLGDRILNKTTGEQFLVQTDSFFLVDSIYAIPTGTNYAVWQPGFNHQGEFILDTIDSGDYKLQIGGDVLINKNPVVTLSLESSLAAIYSARAGTQSGIALLVDYDVDSLAAWSISATMRDLYIGGGPGDILINNQSGNVPFLIKQNPSDSAFTINASGEVLINQREYDSGNFKLQVTGSGYFRDAGLASMYLDGAFGANLDIIGNSYGATLSLRTDGGQWTLYNNDANGNLRLGGTPGKFFDIFGKSGYSPSSTTNITAAGGITVTRGIMRVQGSGGAIDITADPQIVDGNDGEIVILEGMSDTNTLTLDDGTGLQLAGAASFVMGEGDVIQLMYNANRDIWIEITRSDN